ncbi:MAG TPA: hypothetical protein VKY59_15055 [Spirillospora sp.]|nr:hypothetical protein [Spirillospora sp.]
MDMSLLNSDYIGIQIGKSRMEELRREAQRDRQARDVLKLRPVKRRFRLPKITISWN